MMGSLLFNFFKRAFLIPAIVTALIAAAVTLVLPRLILPGSLGAGDTNTIIDLSQFNSPKYTAFAKLAEGDYVGAISSADFELGQTAVVYNTDGDENVSLLKQSTEPWNGGALVLIGQNNPSQLKKLHDARIGNKIVFDFFGNGSYQYQIESIAAGQSQQDIKKQFSDKTLVICLPYNDFSDLSESQLYLFYIAKQIS